MPLLLAALMADLTAGNVLRVGPGRPYASIAAAIAAAQDGDLIAVDPGVYPEFTLDGKGVTIVSAGGAPIVLQAAPGSPAVRIRNLTATQQVSVSDLAIAYADGSAPALDLSACAGTVRIRNVVIDPVADLPPSPTRAVVDVRACALVWFADLSIWPTLGRRGSTLSLHGAPIVDNAGLSAVVVESSTAVFDNPRLRAFDNPGFVNGVSYGGDALRVIGDCHVRLMRVAGLAAGVLRGGSGLTFGGSVVHLVQSRPVSDVESCGEIDLVRGAGSSAGNVGGEFAINNDRGRVQSGSIITDRGLVPCLHESYGAVTVNVASAPPGAVLQVRLSTAYSPRVYAVFLTLRSGYAAIRGVQGRALIDFADVSTLPIAVGLSAAGGVTHAVPLPNLPGLIGLQLSFQGGLGAPAAMSAPVLSLTMPAMLVVVP